MHVQTQFSIFLVNRPGVLAGLTTALGEAKVNLEALCLVDSGESGVLRIVSEDPDAVRAVLGKEHDRWTETDVLVLDMSNTPGGFAAVARMLADGGVNILYAYCTAGIDVKRNIAVFKVADLEKARQILAG